MINAIQRLMPGQCLRCGNRYNILESEIVKYNIDELGIPEACNVEFNSYTGICPVCKYKFPVKRIGMTFCPDTAYYKEIKESNPRVEDNNIFGKED